MLIHELNRFINRNSPIGSDMFSENFIYYLVLYFKDQNYSEDLKEYRYEQLLDIIEMNYRGKPIPEYIEKEIISIGYYNKK